MFIILLLFIVIILEFSDFNFIVMVVNSWWLIVGNDLNRVFVHNKHFNNLTYYL